MTDVASYMSKVTRDARAASSTQLGRGPVGRRGLTTESFAVFGNGGKRHR